VNGNKQEEYLTAAECAARTGLTVRALRVYERYGLIAPPRTAGSWRLYGPEELMRLNTIRVLKAAGLTLAQIRASLREDDPPAMFLGAQIDRWKAKAEAAERGRRIAEAAMQRINADQAPSIDELCELIRSNHMSEDTSSPNAAIQEMLRRLKESPRDPWMVYSPPDKALTPRAFYVSLHEIQQTFEFGERFVDSYTKTVSLSDGSMRTITLTPMVHDRGFEVVKIEDGGDSKKAHSSYMGVVNSTTINGKLMVQLTSRKLLYQDERACGAAILGTESVQNIYHRFGTDPEVIAKQIAALPSSDRNAIVGSFLRVEELARGVRTMYGVLKPLKVPLPLEVRLLVGLLIHGTPPMQSALTPHGGAPGDIPFFVARGQRESDLRSLWPPPAEQTGNAVLLDDPFTHQQEAKEALHASLGLDRLTAERKSQEADQCGSSVLELAPGSDATQTCRRLNAEWRSRGLSLYCTPQSLQTVETSETGRDH
jgi:DNA-binding transcriptional MerR regulator